VSGTASSNPDLSLVICTLNEAQAIGPVLREVRTALQDLRFEVIVVDDSDDDATARVVLAHAATDDRIRLLRRPGERGLAAAAIAGWSVARGRFLAVMDGDGQHEPTLLPQLAAALDARACDLSIASRYLPGSDSGLSFGRHAMSRAATLFTCLCLGVAVTDPMSGLFVVRRSWFETVRPRLSGIGFKILADLLASGPHRPRVTELRAALRARIAGRSKLDVRVVLELAALVLEKRTRGLVPARFVLFALVGASGIAVNLAALSLLRLDPHVPFWLAQALAIFAAMASNFILNNALTFRERRLKGWAFLSGLALFVLSCLGGAVMGETVAILFQGAGVQWACASLSGIVVAALWNYWAATRGAWRARTEQPHGRFGRLKAWLRPASRS
jgi:dolichol-phosphate mannosyltransferase